MTGHKDWLLDLDETVKTKVRFVDNSSVDTEGIGKVMIKRGEGKPAYVTDVLYVPSMKTNLLSLGQLLLKEFSMSMKKNFIQVFDAKGRSMLKAPLSQNRTFKVSLNAAQVQCFASQTIDDERWLWHHRFGHLNFKSLHQLGEKSMVIGIPTIKPPDQVCDRCLASKQPRNAFKTYAPARAKKSLRVVHSDVCGPLETPSLGGNRYFVTFVDEYTRKIWLYLIKERNEVFSVFVKFCALAERQSGNSFRIFRTDGGGEYTSKEFANFCEGNGIEHEITALYSST